mmetsp:Transcript_40448/g.89861  ORF Transcript_40448/g.89861 Transcript_40448/m.89861 type:complete len:253 (+) Transcript_40448:1348-2106(+)
MGLAGALGAACCAACCCCCCVLGFATWPCGAEEEAAGLDSAAGAAAAGAGVLATLESAFDAAAGCCFAGLATAALISAAGLEGSGLAAFRSLLVAAAAAAALAEGVEASALVAGSAFTSCLDSCCCGCGATAFGFLLLFFFWAPKPSSCFSHAITLYMICRNQKSSLLIAALEPAAAASVTDLAASASLLLGLVTGADAAWKLLCSCDAAAEAAAAFLFFFFSRSSFRFSRSFSSSSALRALIASGTTGIAS